MLRANRAYHVVHHALNGKSQQMNMTVNYALVHIPDKKG